jgi:hypothetical protein
VNDRLHALVAYERGLSRAKRISVAIWLGAVAVNWIGPMLPNWLGASGLMHDAFQPSLSEIIVSLKPISRTLSYLVPLAAMMFVAVLKLYARKIENVLGVAPESSGLQKLRFDFDHKRFRIRQVDREAVETDASVLLPFVHLSDDEIAISLSNPSLRGEKRLRLYQHWLRRSPHSFFVLERFPDGKPVAISIVLPLTEKGWTQISQKNIDIIDLQDAEIGDGEKESYVLIDTVIVAKEPLWWLFHRRQDHSGHLWPFLFTHLTHFWRDDRPITLIVEPDQEGVLRFCQDLGFDIGSYQTKKNKQLCVLRYAGQQLGPLAGSILEYIREQSRTKPAPALPSQPAHGGVRVS